MSRLLLALLGGALALGAAPAQDSRRLTEGWELAPETVAGQRPADGWRPVVVPSTFEDVLGTDFDGVCWYRRRLALTAAERAEATVRVLFRGVATAATVFLDGVEIGGHLGQWTPWRVDLTPHLAAAGAALLEVRVDEKVGHNTQGFLPVIQPHFGGLWRSVELEVDREPRIDDEATFSFGHWNGGAPTLDLDVALRSHRAPFRGRITARLLEDGPARRPLDWQLDAALADGGPLCRGARMPAGVRPWSPAEPVRYVLRLTLRDDTGRRVCDVVDRHVAFRDLAAEGTRVLWNGQPLQVRGMLHWGYSAPHVAPPEDAAFWRPQLERIRSLGCNLVKCCLWIPPQCFYEQAEELGLLVWQEYPTWHPQLTQRYLPELRQEYEEFHAYDRSHAAVAFRSLTCETGHSAELAVIRALYDRCKELVPDTLVVDDSAWIEWHRVHDFYDDHPYGNNRWWPGKLASMRQYIAERGAKPLLLGECITSDTWLDLDRWQVARYPKDAWWTPWGLAAQNAFRDWIAASFGPDEARALLPESIEYSLRNRKYQIERIRQTLPDAGYVLSVVRDITKCRMGFIDDFGDLKWTPEQWRWHGDTMICLDTDDDRQAFPMTSGPLAVPVRIAHSGAAPLRGTLRLTVPEIGVERTFTGVALEPGSVSGRFVLQVPGAALAAPRPRRVRVEATLTGGGAEHGAATHNAWDLWVFPAASSGLDPRVRIVDHLDADTVADVRAGARVLLLAGDRKGSLLTRGLWFLRGAPFAPPHPIHATCPPDFLEHLQAFDLEDGRVMQWEPFADEVDPVLAFWDTHDLDRVDRYALAFTARLGAGRLGATVLDHDSPAGRYVLEQLVATLATGPAPVRGLTDQTIAALRGALTGQQLDLIDWEIAVDPRDRGRGEGWADGGDHAGAAWRPIHAGRHWEAEGIPQYDGVAWYRRDVTIPAGWSTAAPIHLVFEGVDDSYHLFLDGREIAHFGDPATGETVWLTRTTVDVAPFVQPGRTHRLVLRVVDHVGAGGINGAAFLTTAPLGPKLVH
ncbi:MAG: hypothetical protein IPM29_13785 [Planctomycetes bacterium]|nr:hypothetical protein [Planctomycetota bacterium]